MITVLEIISPTFLIVGGRSLEAPSSGTSAFLVVCSGLKVANWSGCLRQSEHTLVNRSLWCSAFG